MIILKEKKTLSLCLNSMSILLLISSGLVAIKREKPIEEIMKIVAAATCEKVE